MTKKSKILYTIFLLILLFVPPLIAYNYYELPGIKGYKPPEGFPWNWEPKTGEQMAWLNQYIMFPPPPRGNYDIFNTAININSRGYIDFQVNMSVREILYKDFLDIMNPLVPGGKGLKPGGVTKRMRFAYFYPPSIRGNGTLLWDYFDTPYIRKDADTWIYSHVARRVRRLATGERADSIGGTLFSYDDVIGREVFEHDYKIIGEDRITDFPWNLKYARLFESDWTPPEAIDTVVIESKPKLPNYYFGKRILWFDKKRGFFVREEQYDRDGYLWKIFVNQRPDETDPKTGKKFVSDMATRNMWDPNIDYRSFSFSTSPKRGDKVPHKESWYQPDDLKREMMWREIIPLYPPPPPELKLSDLPPRPNLYVGKFPEYRKIRPDTLKRLGITK